MFKKNRHLWGIILAGGQGLRLEQFIRSQLMRDCPKQYCSFLGSRSMLRHTIDRAERLIASERLLTVVSQLHHKCVQCQLSDRPAGTVVVQPVLRETGPAILYPLLHVDSRDMDATVAIFPSDHFVLEEDRLVECVRNASIYATQHPNTTILLGIEPNRVEAEYGWIETNENFTSLNSWGFYPVKRFWEKPDLRKMNSLSRRHILWNTMVIVGRVKTLLLLFKTFTPQLYTEFTRVKNVLNTIHEKKTVEQVYANLPSINFSRSILSKNPNGLRVLKMHGLYWSDWGNPERIQADLIKFGRVSTVKPRCTELTARIRGEYESFKGMR